MTNNRNISFWWDTLPPALAISNRTSLNNDLDVDVAIVGAGFTGLWTALYLKQNNSNLDIAIIDANVAGFGASGRNGGWCSALFPTTIDKLGRMFGPDQARAMQIAMHETVTEIESVTKELSIDCDWQRGGSLVFARSTLQRDRAIADIENWRKWGFGEEDYCYLTPEQTKDRAQVTKNYGSTFTPHVAAINPAKLVRGLALAVENLGVKIYENTAALRIDPGMVTTQSGVIRSRYVVRATEGYTQSLAGLKRAIAPIYSLMVATEPLSDQTWSQIGLAKREVFSDGRNLIIYGQRTSDNRFAFGGRGAPYHFGSKVKPEFDRTPRVHNAIFDILVELFPVLEDKVVTHTWGGPLGIARDWMATASFDTTTGIAHAGGYVGDGVGTSNLAGRTLADLITRKDSPLVKLPWVNHRSPNWETEPLRWIGANLGLQSMAIADASESIFNRESKIPKLVGYFTGK